MEFPEVGKHCSSPNCNKLDFLPIKCDACSQIYCNDHYFYTNHNCLDAHRKDNQVPVCPLCNQPVPVGLHQQPDAVVGTHIDNDCQADPAKDRRKVFTHKCLLKGCKQREVVPLTCAECTLNYCLRHRHPQDHKCPGPGGARRSKAANAASLRLNQPNSSNFVNVVHGNMSEDEALARALALSMQETTSNTSNKCASSQQEELDLALARQLQASDAAATATSSPRSIRNACILS